MTGRPKILVLLASYNGEAYIRAQIVTILDQLDVDVIVHVRDDGSRDGTVAVVEEIAAKDPRVRLVTDEAGPTGWAAGNFFQLLRSADLDGVDHVAFADQDDLWLPRKLATAVAALAAAEADGYSCNLIAFDDAGLAAPYILRKDQPQQELDYLFQGGSAGCTYVLTRKAADRLAAWLRERAFPRELGLSHDWTAYALVRATGLGWVNDAASPILYRQHARNEYGARGGWAGLKQRTEGMRSGWYRRHIRWLLDNLPDRPGHQAVQARVARLSIADRLWLVGRAGQLRRAPREATLLRGTLLTGAFR